MRPYASLGAGITDVVAGPDGRLYVATSDAIWTVAPASAGATLAPAPASESVPTTVGPGGDGDGSARPWIAAIALAVIAIGLGLRFAAGRRLRAETRDEERGSSQP
jgi:hypothetical protein